MNIFICLGLIVPLDAVCAVVDYVDHNISGASRDLYNDTEILKFVRVDVATVNIAQSLTLVNNGILNSDIHVFADRNFYFANSGTFSGAISADVGGKIIQLIRNDAEITDVGNYDVLVCGPDSVSLSGVLDVIDSTSLLMLDNANLVYDIGTPILTNVRLMGDVVFYMNTIPDADMPIISGAVGDGRVRVYVNGLDSLFVARTFVTDGDNNVYVRVVRETDYIKILNNDVGRFLNYLRTTDSNNSLLGALDGATTMGEIGNIMSRSARLNPIKMMEPIRAINIMNGFRVGGFEFDSDFTADADLIYSDDASYLGAIMRIGFRVADNLLIGLSGNFGTLNFSSDIDNYSAYVFGGVLNIDYSGDVFVARGHVGTRMAMFDSGAVYSGNAISENPTGLSLYGGGDVGVKFAPFKNLSVIPFVGVMTDYARLLDSTDSFSDAYIGTDIGCSTNDTYSLRYDYALRVRAGISGDIGAMLRIGAWSMGDDAGVAIEAGRVFSDSVPYNRVSITGSFLF